MEQELDDITIGLSFYGNQAGIYGRCLTVFISLKYQDQISDILASKTKRLLLAVKDQELNAEVLI